MSGKPHLNTEEIQKRNDEILKGNPREMADKYGMSLSHVYRIRRDAAIPHSDNFIDQAVGSPQQQQTALGPSINDRFSLFEQLAKPGLLQFSGNINEDYDNVFKPLTRKYKIYREMADDPIVASVLNAVRMRLRSIAWRVIPAGKLPQDEQAAMFLDTCMHDMAYSWMDVIDQTLEMLQYGFSLAELVYKKRTGVVNSKTRADSKYDDGLIGWRKWIFISPDTLQPGTPWTFDDSGALQGFTQLPPPIYRPVSVPIEKAILFRTTTFKNNPEGRAILRPMYPAWYFKKNLEEIEAISAERLGAGYPVIYLGADVNTNANDPNSDISYFMKMGRNIRVDEQMAAVIPFKKMGVGANNDNGAILEFLSPPSSGNIKFDDVIQRYEKRMAMVGLAQFIHLGMDRVGSQALSQSSMDFFTLAISSWADLIEETIHRFATERLFALNPFQGLTDYPRITHDSVGKVALGELADYINKLAGQMLITPSPELEDYLRAAADLPEKPAEVTEPTEKPSDDKNENAQSDTGDNAEPSTQVDNVPHDDSENAAESFADKRGGGPGRGSKQIRAVNAYQYELEGTYKDWSGSTAKDIANAQNDDERRAAIEAALLALLAQMREEGHRELTNAMLLALGTDAPTPEMLSRLSQALSENDQYLSDSLIPDLRAKIEAALRDPDILAAMELGLAAFIDALRSMMMTSLARVALYAGAWWTIYNWTIGAKSKGEIHAYLDPQAHHCTDCPKYQSVNGRVYESFDAYLAATGGRVPGQFACHGNCRCELK